MTKQIKNTHTEGDIETMTPDAVLARRVKLNDTSLTFAENTSFEEWREVYAFADKLNERGKFWLGDIVHYAEGKFPDRYTQAIEMTGLSYSRLTTLVSVCSRVDPARRRKEAPFHWHEKIAYLPYQTGDHLLDRAIKEKWTSEQLADAVARAKGEPTAAEKKAAKEAKPGSTAAKVAASGKQPQVPESEKPLVWNGYPLRVMVMPDATRVILQGNEPLPADEADRAAHEHGHAHGPNLAKWLEEHNFIKGGDEPCAQKTTSTCSDKSNSQPSPTAPEPDTSEKTASASNGATPDATASAPTPLVYCICPECSFDAVIPRNQATGVSCPICAEDKGVSTALTNTQKEENDFPLTVEGRDARNERTPQITPTPAPAAPPASPEAEKTTETAKDHQGQLLEMQRACDALQRDALLFQKQRDEAMELAERFKKERAGAMHSSENWELMHAKRHEELAQAIIERDDARDQRYDVHTAAMTPIQRAEEAISAFNEASKAVNWAEVGKNALLRQKWLSRLLIIADQTIDTIQNNPPAPRK